MCDAVQGETYPIDGIRWSISSPIVFHATTENKRNDFLERLYNGNALSSFGVNQAAMSASSIPGLTAMINTGTRHAIAAAAARRGQQSWVADGAHASCSCIK
jgi:hypothetical protein